MRFESDGPWSRGMFLDGREGIVEMSCQFRGSEDAVRTSVLSRRRGRGREDGECEAIDCGGTLVAFGGIENTRKKARSAHTGTF